MAVVKCDYMVVPASPTPNGRLFLSVFDQHKPLILSPILYFYKPDSDLVVSTAGLIRTLTASLAKALVPFYPLAGRHSFIARGRLEIDCNATGAQLVVAESESNLEEHLSSDPTPTNINHLLPNIDYTSPIETLPIVSALATRFACGGLTIGFAISHAIADGGCYTQFVNSWAKLARGQDLDENDLPCYDLFKLPPHIHHSPAFDHVEFKPLPAFTGRQEEPKHTTAALLKLTSTQVKELKKRANLGYSAYEAVSAHTWRCFCKAWGGDARQPTVVKVVVDCRSRLKPPLPRGYAGNAVLNTITDPKCVFGDIIAKPMSYVAGKIRETKDKFSDEYIKSLLSLIDSHEDMRQVRSSFHVEGSRTDRRFGSPNISITSWLNVPFFKADFGWGKPVRISPSAFADEGKCFFVPISDNIGDGLMVVALGFQIDHMELFKTFFYQDITPQDHISSKL